ncbi:MAG TPA: DUF4349 domain-containing protein [Candidatus Limnocylindrales bacterium]|nr:DUF4349 domain-containing protein [Candidatus Limnocylindrales bacterium]
MNTQSTEDRADEALRALLIQADPEAGAPQPVPTHLLDRVRAAAASGDAPVTAGAPADPPSTPTSLTEHPSFLARHWQGMLMAAAGVATLALAAGSVLPGLTVGSGSDSTASIGVSDSAGGGESMAGASEDKAALDGSVSAPEMAGDAAVPSEATSPTTGVRGADTTEEALVRSGSVLVGTEDPEAARDTFVATVLAMGGRVTSESVVTEDSGGGIDPYVADSLAASRDMGMSYPYPWYPSGPGIWLTVQVPVEDYDEAMEAARDAGEVVQMQQSTYDVGAQVADVDARIAALEASLLRLTALMDEATDITDVITLEQAISQRQSELDALRAQQRDLANQTAMSQISLTLMSPEDAQNSVDPQPQQTWWESFLEGLSQFWSWFGQALLIISPLLIAMGIIAWVRRRRAHRTAQTTPQPASASAPTGPDAPTPGDPTA